MKEFNLNGLKLHFVSNTTQLVHVTALTYQTVSEHMFVGVYVYMHAWVSVCLSKASYDHQVCGSDDIN